MLKSLFIAAIIPALAVMADPVPSEPAPGDVFNQGAACTIQWTADTTGTWTTMNIELMTGSNAAMTHLTTVATVDGTKVTSFVYTCPEVTPNSAIYFYQFSSPAEPTNLTWTGRFAIADTSGNTVAPTETTDGIKWGTGSLVGPSSASAAPTYLSQAAVSMTTGSTTATSTDAATTSSAAAIAPAAVTTSAASAGTGTSTASSSLATVKTSSIAASAAANQVSSSSPSGSAAASSSATSGASALVLDFQTRSIQALAGLVGTAFVFITML